MYEHVPVQRVVDDVSHIYALYHGSRIDVHENKEAQRARLLFLRDLINNLKHEKSYPSPRILAELSRRVQLATGGSFRLFGYRLDKMREVDFLLHGHQTRIIESYPFHRDREIDLPRALSAGNVFERNAFLSEIVLSWQRKLPIRTLQGKEWQRAGVFYVQIGLEDSAMLSGLPPGAILSVTPASAEDQAHPDPSAIYFVQLGNGYRCCSCTIFRGKLVLLPYDHRYAGRFEFLYPQEARIVGKARGFASTLPPAVNRALYTPRFRASAPLILPWEQSSLSSLLQAERSRLGLDERAVVRANEILGEMLGTRLSNRTLRRYAHATKTLPHTNVLLALTLFHAARMSDIFRSLGFWHDESQHYSLKRWREVNSLRELRTEIQTATIPEPRQRWEMFLGEWGEWPALLSMAIPRMEQFQHRLLRIRQHNIFDGLNPLIRPGAVALIEEIDKWTDMQTDRDKSEWERPIYAVRHGRDVFCGYLDGDGDHVSLIPHPRSSARRLTFLHHQVEVMGKVIGVASPFRQGR